MTEKNSNMSFAEFKDALKYIISKEGDIPKNAENNDSTSENTDLFSDIVYILSFKFLSDFINWCKVPLTKDVFIKRGKSFKKWFNETVETVVFVLVMVIIIRFFVGEIRWIPSGSMHPTLIEGDRIFVERYSRFYTTPQRGDIMVFYPPSTKLSNSPIPLLSRLTGIFCKDVAYIKRVVGLPGEKIEIKFEKDGAAYVYIDDRRYEEAYVQSPFEYPICPPPGYNPDFVNDGRIMKCGPFKLKDDEYFMMGDNRGNSQDSRYWGPLKKDRFIGRAVAVFWPVRRSKKLDRYARQSLY